MRPRVVWTMPMFVGRNASSKRFEKGDQVALLAIGEADSESGIVEFDDVPQIGRGPVVEIGGSGCEVPQDRTFGLANIRASTADQSFPWIGDLEGLSGKRTGIAADIEDREARGVQAGRGRGHDTDIERQRNAVIAHIRR